MKTNKILLAVALIGLYVGSVSCSDFMNLSPSTEYTEEQVFSDAALTQSFVNTLYDYVIDGAREHTTTGVTDDAYFTHNYGQITRLPAPAATCSGTATGTARSTGNRRTQEYIMQTWCCPESTMSRPNRDTT